MLGVECYEANKKQQRKGNWTQGDGCHVQQGVRVDFTKKVTFK